MTEDSVAVLVVVDLACECGTKESVQKALVATLGNLPYAKLVFPPSRAARKGSVKSGTDARLVRPYSD